MSSEVPAVRALRTKVPERWQVASFAEVTDFQEGPGILAKDFHNFGTPLLRLRNIQGAQVKLEGCNYLDPKKVEKKWAHFQLAKDDLLISTSASLGRVSVVPQEAAGSIAYTGIIRFRTASSRVHQPYLRAFLSSALFIEQAESMATGSVMKHFGPSHLRQMAITIPTHAEQVQIANVFDALDNRITLLCETNATLEAIAQALFKSWFVDFDPVRAKMQGRAPEGMDEATAALFPDGFEESELGLVPKGWWHSTVGESFVLTMGQSPPGDTYNESGEGLPFYQGRTDFGFRFPTQRVYCLAPTRYAEPGDTLVSVRAPVGDVNMALERCCIGRGVAAVRHPLGFRGFAFYAMRGLGTRFKTFDSEGTVFGSINKKDFQDLPVVASPEVLLRAFDELTSPIDQRVVEGELMLRTLSTLRDTLLPRLISGQLRLPDAAALIEDPTHAYS